MAEILFSPLAVDDLRSIQSYIRDELGNPQAADSTIAGIIERIEQLRNFPELGTELRDTDKSLAPYRRLTSGNYSIFYRNSEMASVIVRVLYSKRDFMRILFE